LNRLQDRLETKKILVADGATGTNLHKLGLPAGAHTEDWVLERPDKILELEKAFVDAGSDILLTCSFGATAPRLKGSRHAQDAVEINKMAAALARQAISARPEVLVAGSMGPLGQLLKPYGPLSLEEAGAAYSEQAVALAEGGVDLLVIETQFSMEEAQVAVDRAQKVTDLPVIVSFSFDRGTRTMMGVRPSDVISTYRSAGLAMIGANCGTTLNNMESILAEYASAAPEVPLWAKPNAGLPHVEGSATVYDVSPAQMAEFAVRAARLGAQVIGGCCGSTPEHISAMAAALAV
jgi:methionine synthase I (cobalamin-dependent)